MNTHASDRLVLWLFIAIGVPVLLAIWAVFKIAGLFRRKPDASALRNRPAWERNLRVYRGGQAS